MLSSLCEFIEDCEYPDVACDVLHIIGRDGPKHPNPILILRHVFNRLLLEVSTVRMAALGTLIKFGSELESCRDLVVHLIKQRFAIISHSPTRCLQDEDVEIRDRALIFINSINFKSGDISSLYDEKIIDLDLLEQRANLIISGKSSLQALEQDANVKKSSIVESIKSLCKCNRAAANAVSSLVGKTLADPSSTSPSKLSFVMNEDILLPLYGCPMDIGSLIHQSPAVPLTEPDTEYIVTVTKYLYYSALILRFSCTNTITHIHLEDLHINIELPEQTCNLFDVKSSFIPSLKGALDYTTSSSSSQDLYYVFVLKESSDMLTVPLGTFPARMSFSMREVDFIAGELAPISVPDQYKVNDAVAYV